MQARQREGRVLYRLTGAGRELLERSRPELQLVELELERRAQEGAGGLRAELRGSARALREELAEEARGLSRPEPPQRRELEAELERFTAAWSRRVPPSTSREQARSMLRSAIGAALQALERSLGRPADPADAEEPGRQ